MVFKVKGAGAFEAFYLAIVDIMVNLPQDEHRSVKYDQKGDTYIIETNFEFNTNRLLADYPYAEVI